MFGDAHGFVEIFRMEILQEHVDGATVIRADGRLEAGADRAQLAAFRTAVDALVAVGRTNIVVDLSSVASVDAEGLGELVYACQRLTRLGGGLTLAAPPGRVRRLLAVTRLDTVFPIVDSLTRATAGRAEAPCREGPAGSTFRTLEDQRLLVSGR